MSYQESQEFRRTYSKYPNQSFGQPHNVQKRLLEFVLTNASKNNPKATEDAINQFCRINWMMNVGDEKGAILKLAVQQRNPKTILELGGYCGFSALIMASTSNANVHSLEPNQYFASIARQIHAHAGLSNRIIIHVGTLQTQSEFVKSHGAFDFIFIDHSGYRYLPDLLELEKLGGIKKSTIVVGDNILFPGAPEYLQYFKQSKHYNSTLYHSYLEYSDSSDAILVSQRIS